jgi:hypothetical protein
VSTSITTANGLDAERLARPALDEAEWQRLQRGALVAAAAGAVLFAVVAAVLWSVGGVTAPRQFFQSYLVAFIFCLGSSLGCLVLLMIQHLTGGAWGLVLRRVLEAGARTLVPLAVALVPLLVGVPYLYLWADQEVVNASLELQHKSLYLNVGFFIVRAAGYFVVWLLLAFLLTRWSADQDRQANPERPQRFQALCGPGLVVYGLTITFASIDWVMSLEPHWFSTIYPVMFAVGQILNGFTFALMVLLLLAGRPPLSEVLTRQHLRDLGSLLLAFVLFWAYMAFSQFLLDWVGNLPEEIPWYLRRLRGGWEWLALALVLFHFALPFLLLLSSDVKMNRRSLVRVAVALLIMRFVDVFWWIEPAYSHEGQYFFWLLDLSATLAVGGVCGWWFLGQLRQRPLLPLHDPYLAETLHHE